MLITLLLLLQTIVTIDQPIAQEKYVLKLEREIKLDNEFYHKTYSAISSNGDIIVIDHGNKKIKILDKYDKITHSFGREGNGPGEFQGPRAIYVHKNHFYINDLRTFHVYDSSYNLLNEVNYNNNLPVFTDKWYKMVKYTLTKESIYDFDGNFISEKKISAQLYDVGNKNLPSIAKYPKDPFYTPIGVISNYYGDYTIEIRDEKYKILNVIKKNLKREYNKPKIMLKGEAVSKTQKEKLAKLMKQKIQKAAIYAGIGYCNSGFVMRTTIGDSRHLTMDLISFDLKYLAFLELKFSDKITSAKIHQNKLVVDLRNDEIGPYIQIYSIVERK